MSSGHINIDQLWKDRPRNRFLRLNGWLLPIVILVSWYSLDIDWGDAFSTRRLEKAGQFIEDLTPYSLRGEPFSLAALCEWSMNIMRDRGTAAVWTTVHLSIVSMALVALMVIPAMLLSTSTLIKPDPFIGSTASPSLLRTWGWRFCLTLNRGWLAIGRAIPEYVWAFLLVMVFGPNLWPAVIALTIHNVGIMGKLGAELFDNIDPATPAALRGLGMTRKQIGVFYFVPTQTPKLLAYFFLRWESCIREAVVLGTLGIATIGYWIIDARSRQWYDEMFFFILLGTGLVIMIDAISAITRAYVRKL